jgi:hypothetical protein
MDVLPGIHAGEDVHRYFPHPTGCSDPLVLESQQDGADDAETDTAQA